MLGFHVCGRLVKTRDGGGLRGGKRILERAFVAAPSSSNPLFTLPAFPLMSNSSACFIVSNTASSVFSLRLLPDSIRVINNELPVM